MGDVVDLDAYRRARQERESRRRKRRPGLDAPSASGNGGATTEDKPETTGTGGPEERGSPKSDR
jgi:hypothetical protein